MPVVARLRRIGSSPGAWGTAVTVWRLWRRIPPKHRKLLLSQARKHGPRLAKQVYSARKKSRWIL
jgi:hypothetical protein